MLDRVVNVPLDRRVRAIGSWYSIWNMLVSRSVELLKKTQLSMFLKLLFKLE